MPRARYRQCRPVLHGKILDRLLAQLRSDERFFRHSCEPHEAPADRKDQQAILLESDLLFRLNVIEARVVDIPMHALMPTNRAICSRTGKSAVHEGPSKNFIKRIFYRYFLRDFSVASIELLLGFACLLSGLSSGWRTGDADRLQVPGP